jgi:hypothetical protein
LIAIHGRAARNCARQYEFRKFRKETKVKRRLVMYTGTLIDELISTVERAEAHAHKNDSHDARTPYWYTATEGQRALESNYLGVA